VRDRFATNVFGCAGVVGIVEIVPLYFYEHTLNRTQPPPLTHPEFYYGFLGAVLAWHGAFLLIARDPRRYRPFMAAAIFEKLLYAVSVFALSAASRVASRATLAAAVLDAMWFALFVACWRRTADRN
jgi:hypothetical protein